MKSLVLFLLVFALAGGLMMVGCGEKESPPPVPAPEGLEVKPPEGAEEKMEEAEKAAEEAGSEMKEAVEGAQTE